MDNDFLLQLLLEIHPIETRLQILKNKLVSVNSNLSKYKKAQDINADDIGELQELREKILIEEDVMTKYIEQIRVTDNKIKETGYMEELNLENYYKLLDWSNEIEKRESDKVEQIYKMKKGDIKRQGNFVKIFSIIRNISILLAVMFLVLRNYLDYDITESLSTNFSILGVALLLMVGMASYVHKKNLKIFETIEINYVNNQNVLRLLKLSIQDMLNKCECRDIEDFHQKIEGNTKKFEEVYKLQKEKQELKNKLDMVNDGKKTITSKFYNIVNSLNVKFNKEDLEETIKKTKQSYNLYSDLKNEFEMHKNEFDILWEQYKNKSKLCEKLWLEEFYQ